MTTVDCHEMKVNIYIETTCKGPAKRAAAGGWLVEYKLKSGKPVTRGGIFYSAVTTENEMALRLLEKAFSILNKTCSVRVFTSCQHILNTMNSHWLWMWQKNGWLNAKGRPVSHADLWKRCAALLEKHIVEWTGEPHAYGLCMQARLRKELSAVHGEAEMEVAAPEWNTGKE